jgi:antirestriction protein ArdC
VRGWQVRKGERSTTIFFTKPYEVEDDDAEDGTKTIRVLKHYAVFHASQIDGVPAYNVRGRTALSQVLHLKQ